MALIEINKPVFELSRDNRIRWTVQYSAATKAEALASIPRTYESAPFTGAQGTPWIGSDGRWNIIARYERMIAEGSEEFDEFEIDGELRETPIEELTTIRQELIDEYGGYEEEGKLKFPPKMPSLTAAQLAVGPLPNLDDIEDNPLFNLRTFPVEYNVARWRMVRKKLPARILKLAGTVQRRLPRGFEYDGDAESWYVRPIRRRKARGGYWEISVEYQEIDEFKAIQALHDLLGRTRSGT